MVAIKQGIIAHERDEEIIIKVFILLENMILKGI